MNAPWDVDRSCHAPIEHPWPAAREFLALLPSNINKHPLGCHRRRTDDAVVFGKLVEALVFGAGYERLADAACSATMRRRRDEWTRLGV